MKLMDLVKLAFGKKVNTECINCEHDKPTADVAAMSSSHDGGVCSSDGSCCAAQGGECCGSGACQH